METINGGEKMKNGTKVARMVECSSSDFMTIHDGACCGKWTCACDSVLEYKFRAIKSHLDNEHSEDKHSSFEHTYYGTCATCRLFGVLDDMPMQCPRGHATGRQIVIYENGVNTGKFTCEICRITYNPHTDKYPVICMQSVQLSSEEWKSVTQALSRGTVNPVVIHRITENIMSQLNSQGGM